MFWNKPYKVTLHEGHGYSDSEMVLLLQIDAIIPRHHYSDVITSMTVCQITGVSIVYLTVCSGTDIRKHQSSASLAFVKEINQLPVNSSTKGH